MQNHKSHFSSNHALRGCRRLLPLVVFLMTAFLQINGQANAISVENFEYNINDQTAVTYPVKDPQSRRNCALIIFDNVDVGDYKFSVNGFCKREDKTSHGKKKIWLYVYPGCKVVTIANPAVTDKALNYNFGRQLESDKTYQVTLGNVFLPTNQKQFLTFKLNPPRASIEVNGEPWAVTNGTAQESVKLGRYEIKAVCDDYHTYRDVVEFADASKPMVVEVNLKPAFGYLDIEGGTDVADADIFVNSAKKGEGNVKQIKLSSGEHIVKITKRLYKTAEYKVVIKDGETTVLKPVMVPDFSVTTLTAPENAEIWLDGKMLARGEWKGPLEVGEYIINVRKAGHEPKSMQIKIESISTPHEFTLPAPVPIYGSISVKSTPADVQVKLDGKVVANNTPFHINNVLIGEHTLTLEKSGYQTYVEKVKVEKDVTASVTATLTNIIKLGIRITPSDANVYADGRKLTAPYYVTGRLGSTVKLTASKYGYKDYSTTETFDQNGRAVYINLKAKGYDYKAPRGWYLDLGGSLLGIMGINANFGGYIGHSGVNIEANYSMGFSEEEIYWHPVSNPNSTSETSYYKPIVYGGKIGYGIRLNRSFDIEYYEGLGRGCVLTPQIGLRLLSLSAYPKTYCMAMPLSLRFEWRTSNHFGFYLIPEYNVPVSKGEIYKALSLTNKNIKKWGEGFNLMLGISIIFG